jgi:hypothetical protein
VKSVVGERAKAFFAESPETRFTAVLFRGKVYVEAPRHQDAIDLAFAGMTQQQARRVCWRIMDKKEDMLFGFALGDGSAWEWDEKNQSVRLEMYHLNG